jgi:segregation and condensation protein A
MDYNVKLENFEGPLDLLLYLVRKNEIDIQQIPVIAVTSQYMEYLELMKVLNLDIAGEFLVMAATLLYLKSRALLPNCDDDEDSEEAQSTLEDLKRQLLEYQQYKDAAQRLREQNILEKDVFTRACIIEPTADDAPAFREASIFELLEALKKVFERTGAQADIMSLTMEHMSVKDRISQILERLEGVKDGIEFEALFEGVPERLDIITTFLAILELIKMQALKVYQNANFSKLYVYGVADDESPGETASEELTQE